MGTQLAMSGSGQSSTPVYTVGQLATMDATTRATAIAAMPADQQAVTQRQVRSFLNAQFMNLSLKRYTRAIQSSGQGTQQTYVPGQQLFYTIQTKENGYMTGFWLEVNVPMIFAAGTGATYQLNAAAPLNLIKHVAVMYGGVVHDFDTYMLKYLHQLSGARRAGLPETVMIGQSDAGIEAWVESTFPVTGSPTWVYRIFFPMNLLHKSDARGILPAQSQSTEIQIVVNTTDALLGVDPVNNVVSSTGGTGNAVTVGAGSFVSILAEYRDGSTWSKRATYAPDIIGLETMRFVKDAPLNALLSGTIMNRGLKYKTLMPYLLLTVIDGNQSNLFSARTNLQMIEASKSSTEDDLFFRFGANTNIEMNVYWYNYVRDLIKQDLDQGIVPLVAGPLWNQAVPDLLEGLDYLNTSLTDGWRDFHFGLQLGSVGGVAGINPRVEIHALIFGAPLQIVS